EPGIALARLARRHGDDGVIEPGPVEAGLQTRQLRPRHRRVGDDAEPLAGKTLGQNFPRRVDELRPDQDIVGARAQRDVHKVVDLRHVFGPQPWERCASTAAMTSLATLSCGMSRLSTVT